MGKNEKITAVLDGTNFLHWRYELEITLRSLELWSLVDGTRKKPGKNSQDSDFVTDCFDALKHIIRSVDKDHIRYIYGIKCPKEAFDRLVTIYEKSSES